MAKNVKNCKKPARRACPDDEAELENIGEDWAGAVLGSDL
jgi:hypothetical protein